MAIRYLGDDDERSHGSLDSDLSAEEFALSQTSGNQPSMSYFRTISDCMTGSGTILPRTKTNQLEDGTSTPVPINNYGISKHAASFMNTYLPLLWCVLIVTTLDRQMLLSAWFMPLLGIFSATLANAVPVGGGIVFVPALALLGVKVSLGASFTVATMTFGNGVFGFLSWIQKDPSKIHWSALPYAVLPAWGGALLGIFHPFMESSDCKRLFAGFALCVAMIVFRAVQRGNIVAVFQQEVEPSSTTNGGGKTSSSWAPVKASVASFMAGFVLVANIGIGNAVTSFLVLVYVWRVEPQVAVVTSIIAGGWTSFAPFMVHLLVLRDVPIALWVMVLPGVYFGARVAPVVHNAIGIQKVLAVFGIFLVATAALMLMTA